MSRVKNTLEQWGAHAFLLPVFFILHTYIQYYGLVSGHVAMGLLGTLELLFLGFFVLVLVLSRNHRKTALITTFTGTVMLFYGVAKDFFSKTLQAPFLAKYTVLLPATAVLTILLIIVILRKKTFGKINLFLNLLLLVCIIADGALLFRSQDALFLEKNMLVSQNRLAIDSVAAPAGRPDVYYLLFDCYPGSGFLHTYMQFNNTATDSSLQQLGFHLVPHSTSNYNRTCFSLASTLNFEYLQGITDHGRISPKQYNQALLSVEHAAVPAFFQRNGYTIYNLSIFDLLHHPSLLKETFLTLPEKKILLYTTLPERIQMDIGWHFTAGPGAAHTAANDKSRAPDELLAQNLSRRNFNALVADSLAKIPALAAGSPRFVYAHFYLPHPPFFFDKNGKANDVNTVLQPSAYFSKPLFLGYLQYTNTVMLALVRQILNNSPRPPVIIIEGDHGFTDFPGCPDIPALYFKNYSAFYFPDKNYSTVYDSMSNVNTFPVLLNKYFNTHLALQRDSTFFLSF